VTRSAVIFDLDGTLTKPYLDFDRIRREIGIPSGPILEAIAAMPAHQQPRAKSILLSHEWDAARNGELHDDAVEVVAEIRRAGFPVALLTRNTSVIVEFLLDSHGLAFDALRTREHGAIKPSPAPVLSLCDELNADPAASWVVGDYLFDLQSGRAAGTRTVLMIGDNTLPTFADLADHVIRRLRELPPILSIQRAA
jgi:HAD superfamily hydrolase (TIGR01509 family)